MASLARILDTYTGRGPTEEADLRRVRGLDGDPWRRDSPLHVTVSALIAHRPTGRVLLRWHAREGTWLQVGGHADPGETDPLAIVAREGREETGLDDLVPWPDATPVQLVVVPVTGNAKEPAHEHADLRYLMITERPERARPENPEAPLRWLSIPDALDLVDQPNLHELLHRGARRLGQ